MISTEALDQFKQIIQQDYGLEFDDTEATKLADDYLTALEAVLKSSKEDLTTAIEERENDN